MLSRVSVGLWAVVVLMGCSGAETGTGIEAANARIRAPVAGQDKSAGYLDLTNKSNRAVELVAARSPHARSIEFHETRYDGSMMRMRRIHTIVIPRQETVRLAPGGLHLMLFGLDDPPALMEVEFVRADGNTFIVLFDRVPPGAG